jgi:hypothetical protein
MLKIAYQEGLEQALEEGGLEKEAFWGLLGRGALNLGKGLWGASKGLYSGASKILPGGKDTLAFGLFGGGLGALTAEPGSRGEGFLKGFGSGVIGGTGWHYGGKAAKGILGGLAKSKTMMKHAPGLGERMQQVMGVGTHAGQAPMTFRGILGSQGMGMADKAKMLGTKTMVAVPTLGAAWGLSGVAEEQAGKHVPWLHQPEMGQFQDVPRYVGVARDVLRAPRLGLTPPGGSIGAFSGTTPGARTW